MADNFKHKNTDLTLINDSGDLDLIRQYTEAYNKAYAEGDKAGQQAAHDAAEKIRAKYDYSGGVDGSEYINSAIVMDLMGMGLSEDFATNLVRHIASNKIEHLSINY